MRKRLLQTIAVILLLFGLAGSSVAQSYTPTPTPFQTALDNAGNIINNACIWTYVAGTTTAAATYSDISGTPNTNPIRSDSAGRFTAFLAAGSSYKYVYETACTPPAHGSVLRTADNIPAVPPGTVNLDVTGTAGEALTAGQVVYLSDGSASKTAGSWYKADATNTYSSLLNPVGFAVVSIGSGSTGSIRLSGQVTGLSSLLVGSTYYIATSAGTTTATPPTNRRALGVADTTSSLILQSWQLQTPPINNGQANGRLTLTSGTCVTTADVTAASTVYYTPGCGPQGGNVISLYDGTATWTPITFTETSLALSSLVNAQGYDVFGYSNAGVLALETAEWANATNTMTSANPTVVTWTAHGMTTGASITFTTTGALPTNVVAGTQYFITVVDANTFKLSTTLANVAAATFIDGTAGTQSGVHTGHQPQARQTAITLQNGVYVKSGTTTRRYLGSFLATSTTTTEDSFAKRFLSNATNRRQRTMQVFEATNSWAYSIATWRQARATVTNQLAFFSGLIEEAVTATVDIQASNNTGGVTAAVGIGLDSTNANHANTFIGAGRNQASYELTLTALLQLTPTIGRHVLVWLEWSFATATTTFAATNAGSISVQNTAGITGSIWN